MNKPKIMVLHASSGSGHTRAAQALVQECQIHPQIGSVLNVDTLEYTNPLFRDFYAKLYEQMVTRTPDLWRIWYETSNEPWKTDRMRLMLDKINLQDLVKLIQHEQPDITLCTHFLPAEIISSIIKDGKIKTRLAITVTDFYVHAMWLSRVFHRYFVAHEESREHLRALGFPHDRITVSGIPIAPVFRLPRDKQTLRQQYDLDPSLPLILLSAGTFGMESAANTAQALTKLETPVQLVAICGRNDELRQHLQTIADQSPAPFPRFRIEGYTQVMHEWMAMADLFIGKPGGLTTAESLASQLPMVVWQPIPGQEEHNSDHLLENGAAIKCSELLTLPYKIDTLLRDPDRLAAMQRNARRISHPSASRDVIDTLLKHLNDHPQNLILQTE
jgi:processive 1,2-diacylglycerol beta-glucosyltransferase